MEVGKNSIFHALMLIPISMPCVSLNPETVKQPTSQNFFSNTDVFPKKITKY